MTPTEAITINNMLVIGNAESIKRINNIPIKQAAEILQLQYYASQMTRAAEQVLINIKKIEECQHQQD